MYEAILPFDGKTYPTNPTVPPARRTSGEVQGEVVIPETARDELLYQSGNKPKPVETLTIVPGQSIGSLRLGMKKSDLEAVWKTKPDLTTPHENSCRDTEVVWFGKGNGFPGVIAYVADDRVYQITSGWDELVKIQSMESAFPRNLAQLKVLMPGGELFRVPMPSRRDEFFWVITRMGIAFQLDYYPKLGSRAGERRIRGVTVFRTEDKFQPEGCANPDHPLDPVN